MRMAWLSLAAGILVAAVLMLPTGGQSQGVPAKTESDQGLATAIFAGGCFWCVEAAFDAVDGVKETISGYVGGTTPNPTYRQVSSGRTGHAEALLVRYDPAEVDYRRLLTTFWNNIDPLDGGGQFCDRGSQYRSALFPLTDAQRRLAEESKAAVAQVLGHAVATTIEEPTEFWQAEDYHQNYHQENPIRYSYYTWGCGRKARLKEVWGTHPADPLAPLG